MISKFREGLKGETRTKRKKREKEKRAVILASVWSTKPSLQIVSIRPGLTETIKATRKKPANHSLSPSRVSPHSQPPPPLEGSTIINLPSLSFAALQPSPFLHQSRSSFDLFSPSPEPGPVVSAQSVVIQILSSQTQIFFPFHRLYRHYLEIRLLYILPTDDSALVARHRDTKLWEYKSHARRDTTTPRLIWLMMALQ